MKRWIAAALAACTSTAALADYLDKPPLWHCDAARSHVAIWFESGDAPAGVTGAELTAPPPGSGDQTTATGSAYRVPGKTRVQRCGRLQLRLRSAYLNANPEGELGAFEFPALEVFDGRRRVLARTGLAVCDPAPSRWEAFGRCPADFAIVVDITAATVGAPARVRVVHARNDDGGAEVVRETEER